MKTKLLLALFLLAGSSVFAAHFGVRVGVGVPYAPYYGGYGYGYAAPVAPYVAPYPAPYPLTMVMVTRTAMESDSASGTVVTDTAADTDMEFALPLEVMATAAAFAATAADGAVRLA